MSIRALFPTFLPEMMETESDDETEEVEGSEEEQEAPPSPPRKAKATKPKVAAPPPPPPPPPLAPLAPPPPLPPPEPAPILEIDTNATAPEELSIDKMMQQYTTKELQTMLRERQMSIKGKKSELCQRLFSAKAAEV